MGLSAEGSAESHCEALSWLQQHWVKVSNYQKKSQRCFIFYILSSNHDFKEPK